MRFGMEPKGPLLEPDGIPPCAKARPKPAWSACGPLPQPALLRGKMMLSTTVSSSLSNAMVPPYFSMLLRTFFKP